LAADAAKEIENVLKASKEYKGESEIRVLRTEGTESLVLLFLWLQEIGIHSLYFSRFT
jgi:hypothetical protein